MIKNFLYSLFLHFLLFAVLYFGFLRHHSSFIKSNEVTISVAVANSDNIVAQKDVITPKIEKSSTEKEVDESKHRTTTEEAAKPSLEEPIKEKLPQEDKKNDSENRSNQTPRSEDSKKDKSLKKIIKSPAATPSVNQAKLEQIDDVSQHKKISTKSNKDESERLLQYNSQNLAVTKNISAISEGSDLSAREKLNIQLQIKSCYKRAVQESRLDSKIKVLVKILISQEGYIENDVNDMIDIKKYNDPEQKDYKIVIDNIRRALDLCSPLRNLPVGKYEVWKEVILQFDPVFNNQS